MADREIQVRLTGGLKVDAEFKGFVIRTDQPVHDGGEGSAPAPFDLFLASLATCAGYYVVAFCRARDLPTDGIALMMRTEKNPESKLIGKITIRIDLPPGFPEKYREAVAKAADSCTVKAHLLHPPAFDVSAVIRA
ncbi:MAG: OsmC family protein [Candidatus Aminicenantales bacterium]